MTLRECLQKITKLFDPLLSWGLAPLLIGWAEVLVCFLLIQWTFLIGVISLFKLPVVGGLAALELI